MLKQAVLFSKKTVHLNRHKVETSEDGKHWQELYKRECTGWEFKPMKVDREIRYFRVTIEDVSEGRVGLGEITLF